MYLGRHPGRRSPPIAPNQVLKAMTIVTLRRLSLLGLLLAATYVPAAYAASIDLWGPAIDEEAVRADLTNDSIRTHSWMLGKACTPAAGLRVTPYVEVGMQDFDPRISGRFVPAAGASSGRLLFGAVARYSLAPLWTLSADFAAGMPLQPEQEDRPHLATTESDGDAPIWRTGVKLGYTLGKDFSAFTTVEFGNLQTGLVPGPAGAGRAGSEPTETAFHLGFSYKFQ